MKRRKKNADGRRGSFEDYNSDDDAVGGERRRKRRQLRAQKLARGGRNEDSESEFSYRSVHSAGGTRRVTRRRKHADGTYGDEQSYDSAGDEAGQVGGLAHGVGGSTQGLVH